MKETRPYLQYLSVVDRQGSAMQAGHRSLGRAGEALSKAGFVKRARSYLSEALNSAMRELSAIELKGACCLPLQRRQAA